MQIGKTAQNAIAVMSYLAECYRDDQGLVSSQNVANARILSKPLAAKILTTLSQAGYVRGSTGPGGGYALAKKPEDIRFIDVVHCFEVKNQIMQCPFGHGWCGNHDPCPMHDEIERMTEEMQHFLESNHFGAFVESGSSSKRPDPQES
ncbi:Rrf2 family transcriptional regulator [Verrucomicrobiaceae bacterium N1E253]|uniref:Rrf2 family transcriptional regulator n=1 Tax=Oceaniferula marina TaxID=2748318 RepID=A0A851GD83_9BACT|nr:Rrf2 family transcriptional regulator [Oceaniferula marina]NWK55718.1 Rrf2 family transcriptional regulator [Oceaniferula marina]